MHTDKYTVLFVIYSKLRMINTVIRRVPTQCRNINESQLSYGHIL